MRPIDARLLDPAEFEAVLELRQRLDRARDPGLPVTPAAELRALFAGNTTEFFSRHERVAVFDEDGQAVAIGHLQLASDPANTALASVEIDPAAGDPAACALEVLLRRARADSRTSLVAWGDHTRQRHRFWTRLGAELRYTEQESSLDMAAVDAELMDRWASRRAGVELVHWSRSCPEKHIEALVDTTNTMNDAPTGDLDTADVIVDAAMLRTELEAYNTLGFQYQGMLAVTARGGAAVGTTEVLVNRHRPACSWQWNTVVLPEHRGHGIGRWLKAAMWKHLRAAEPDVTMLHTGNATDNAAMLAINAEMGFKPAHTTGFWQTDIASIPEPAP